jgi:hypothetical protein
MSIRTMISEYDIRYLKNNFIIVYSIFICYIILYYVDVWFWEMFRKRVVGYNYLLLNVLKFAILGTPSLD